ncbi:hypothetical protein [Micromonospora arborensis]|nr:hypothetical protein [Micromonospora arborensis]
MDVDRSQATVQDAPSRVHEDGGALLPVWVALNHEESAVDTGRQL